MRPRGRGSAADEPLGDEVVGEADDLVGEEGIGCGDDPAAPGLGGEAARNLVAARFERRAEQRGRLALEIVVRQRAEPVGDRAAVDDRAPVGDQREARRLPHQPSAASRFSA